jgi:hypothetical protein
VAHKSQETGIATLKNVEYRTQSICDAVALSVAPTPERLTELLSTISWAKSVLPVFMGRSSEKPRIAPDHVQIDTTHFDRNIMSNQPFPPPNSPSTGQQ